ncbi:CLUMA_CG007509, isoform A [Clunio marinus]|uniref:CLUMA_CG007509, isoform A n=1 Tax=Clunio marinus TaxID=568069 RepID=A0A1J1I501_9DIPT|nr:CLUMA_CG007509, isoform A [Clunio marinus]
MKSSNFKRISIKLHLASIKIIHWKSFGMIDSNSHCNMRSHKVCFSTPCYSWETHRGSLDRHHFESCLREGQFT